MRTYSAIDGWQETFDDLEFDEQNYHFMSEGSEDDRWTALYYQNREILDICRQLVVQNREILDICTYLIETVNCLEDEVLAIRR